jgi:glycerophosphoryl diester phosphodiesterase
MRTKVFAHRGSSFDCAEQSRQSFEKAIQDGVDGIECDVRLTADRVPICWHDRDLKRLTGRSELVSQIDAATFASLRIIDNGVESGRNEVLEGTPILFEDLVQLAKESRLPLLVETKHPVRSGAAVEAAIAQLVNKYKVEVHLLSFSFTALRRAERLMPQFEHVQLLQHSQLISVASAPIVGLDRELVHRDHGIVDVLRRKGKKIFVWTVNNDNDIHAMSALGVDGIITDKPAHAKKVLGYP